MSVGANVCDIISCGERKTTLSENNVRRLFQIGGKNQKIAPKRRRRRRRSRLNRNARG
jgi:hypothetical protein